MPSSGRWVVLFAGDFAAISALRAAALRRLRSETRLRAQCGRRVTFPAMGKSPKDRRGTAQDERSALIFALPPVPHYGGRVPVRSCNISGAQNLSGFPRFLPGHWALGLQKLPPVRFHFRAWVCRANAPGAYTVGPVWDRPLRNSDGLRICRRGGTPGPPAV